MAFSFFTVQDQKESDLKRDGQFFFDLLFIASPGWMMSVTSISGRASGVDKLSGHLNPI